MRHFDVELYDFGNERTNGIGIYILSVDRERKTDKVIPVSDKILRRASIRRGSGKLSRLNLFNGILRMLFPKGTVTFTDLRRMSATVAVE